MNVKEAQQQKLSFQYSPYEWPGLYPVNHSMVLRSAHDHELSDG